MCLSLCVCVVERVSSAAKVDTYLFDKDGEALIFKRFREFNVLSSFVVYRQRGHDHVGQASQELSHHAIPLFLVTVVYLKSQNKQGAIENQSLLLYLREAQRRCTNIALVNVINIHRKKSVAHCCKMSNQDLLHFTNLKKSFI